ncbi:hypothetical protein C8R47DRAFT_1151022 [Mycena vitilis]|nr:hypothetical protein C8R47DRAFT_1151022 [Mycena vitilis]
MSLPTKRKRALALERPSTSEFTGFGCDDEEALQACDGVLAWLCEPASLVQVADRSIFLERLLYYKRGVNMSEAESFKRMKSEKLPSFSDIRWDDIAELYKLGSSYEGIPRRSQLATCYLPFTLHRKIKCSGWTKMDVNGDVAVQLKEAGIVTIASYAIEAVLALFSGRIINKSDATLPGTPISSGGRVEFQLYTIGNVLIVVCEFKKVGLSNDHAAQLFAEMISAAEANKSRHQDVHGMLSNLEYHHFYTYSPATKTITMGPVFTTASKDRLKRLNYMVDVVNYLFTICLDSFITFVRASRKLSVTRQDDSEVSSMYPQRVADLQPAEVDDADGNAVPVSRPSTLKWQTTDEILQKAQKLFEAVAGEAITVDSINTRGSEGLSLLEQALQEIPRLSSTDGKSGPKNLAELVALIDNDSNFNESWQAAKWQRDAAEKSQKASG